MNDRGCSGVPGEKQREREENDGEIQMRERGEREQVLDGRRGEKVQDVQRGEGDDRAHVERMQRNEREREREGKERREILSEDGREIRWMKEVWKKRERIKKERGGNRN
jgi:hypothetical protein